IVRSIVDYDDFVNIRKIFKDSVQDGADRPLLVECRNDKAQQVVVHEVKSQDGRMEDWGILWQHWSIATWRAAVPQPRFAVLGSRFAVLLNSVFSLLPSS